MQTKKLSECGTRYEVEKGYEVDIEPGDWLVVEAGACVGRPGAKFKHPNIALTTRRIFNFRTYYSSGAKKWHARAGVSHYFVIPRSAVVMLPEKGLSYIPALINGVKVTFNVSGGGGSGVWTDYLRTKTQIGVNHPIKALRAIAEVAVRGTPMEPIAAEPMEPQEEEQWNRAAAKAMSDVKGQFYAMVEAGKKPIIRLMPGYNEGDGVGIELSRQGKMRYTDDKKMQFVVEETGRVRAVIAGFGNHQGKVRVKLSQIDWYETAKANGIAA